MRHKLKWLTVIAGITLLSMVGLQIFWLRTTYKEQKRTFLADAENALFGVLMDETLNKITGKDSLIGVALKKLTTIGAITNLSNTASGVNHKDAGGHMSISLSFPDSTLQDTTELTNILQELKKRKDSSGAIHLSEPEGLDQDFFDGYDELSGIKKHYIKALAAKGYKTRIELAVLDAHGGILQSTCDTGMFKEIVVKTSPEWLKDHSEKIDRNVQVAFPGIDVLLLQKMGTILTISSLLIIFCLSSSTYLLVLFFRQKRISEIKNDFMNNMTHELKTPISSVSVAIELMSDASTHGEPEKVNDYMQIARGELNRLTMLVEKVLKIAAFEKSDISIHKENFLVVSWLQQITNSFKPIFETSGVIFSSQVKPELMMLNADKTHMTNVLQNLIDNALKYNDKPKPVIDIIIQETNSKVYIMVKDNGKGISNNDQNKVFDKFFRVSQGDQHNVKGYGLGLSYVKEIIHLHEGDIQIESVVDHGSTFIITLPK